MFNRILSYKILFAQVFFLTSKKDEKLEATERALQLITIERDSLLEKNKSLQEQIDIYNSMYKLLESLYKEMKTECDQLYKEVRVKNQVGEINIITKN